MPDTDTATLTGHGSVPEAYVHVDKRIVPGEPLHLPGATLKWYDVHRDELPTTAAVRDEARAFVEALAQTERLPVDDELGFVVLHRCGETFHFLLLQTWRGANEVWESVYATDGDGFGQFVVEGWHRPTFCVWELGAALHEQQAWIRYLRSPRDDAARAAWLADAYAGPV